MLSLQEMSDRFEILDVIVGEASDLDRRNWDAYEGHFTLDAVIDYSSIGGPVGSPKEVRAALESMLAHFPFFQHFSCNPEFDIRGDDAVVRTMQLIPIGLQTDTGARTAFSGILFRDTLKRTSAGWKIVHRLEELSWQHNFPDDYVVPEP